MVFISQHPPTHTQVGTPYYIKYYKFAAHAEREREVSIELATQVELSFEILKVIRRNNNSVTHII